MSKGRSREILLGILLEVTALSLIILCVKTILYSQVEPWFARILLAIPLSFFTVLSFVMLIVGYKLIRYESLVKRNVHALVKIVKKCYGDYIKENLGISNVIIFSGVDGSGKSTHAKLLKKILEKKHVRVHMLWARWSGFLSYLLYFYAIIMRRTIRFEIQGRNLKIHAFYTDNILKKLYPILQFIDFFLLKFLLARFCSAVKRKHVVIYDRFILDLVVDLLWETRNPFILKNLLLRALICKALKEHMILFTAELPVIITRKADLVSIKEMSFKRRIFDIFAKNFNIPIIDTSYKTTELTFKELLQQLRIPLIKRYSIECYDT